MAGENPLDPVPLPTPDPRRKFDPYSNLPTSTNIEDRRTNPSYEDMVLKENAIFKRYKDLANGQYLDPLDPIDRDVAKRVWQDRDLLRSRHPEDQAVVGRVNDSFRPQPQPGMFDDLIPKKPLDLRPYLKGGR